MTSISNTRQGQIFDDSSNADISLYFASYNDIDELCNVINWAFRGKPSSSSQEESYSGWIGEQHILVGPRITAEELRELINDEQHQIILVAKLKTDSGLKVVGCYKISTYDTDPQVGDDEKNDVAVDFGLHAVDPDYQSQGIGSLLYKGAIRVAKEYFNAQRIYMYIISVKQNQIDWVTRQGFVETGRYKPFPFGDRFRAKIDPSEIKFSVLTKRL